MSTTEKIRALIAKGEGLNIEFKTAHEVLPYLTGNLNTNLKWF
jgi:hypothetical protein